MGKIVAAVVVVVLAFLGYMWLFDTDIDNGEMPEVEVRGPEISTGTKDVTIEVPTVDIEPADDDADGEEGELMDSSGSEGESSETGDDDPAL